FEDMAKIRAKKKAVEGGANPRDVKFEFAQEIVGRFHGRSAAQLAAKEFISRFRDGALPEEMPEVSLASPPSGLSIAQILRQASLAPSATEANRLIEQGGVKVDGDRVSDRSLTLEKGRAYVIQVGKRKVARITLS
ncbi:MAG TPA: S4 domain-containing protein, partial [Burkholderiales bacterium]|nr:S4 domain-containing protein [Burkholderiales bacterium]